MIEPPKPDLAADPDLAVDPELAAERVKLAATPLRLVHLQSFLAAAEHLHFGRAAESIPLTQSVLSRHIRLLEQVVGARLFDRTTRNVALTQAGEVMVEEARTILAHVDRATSRVRQTEQGLSGTLHIGIVGSSALSVIPQLAAAMATLGPDVQLNFIDCVTDEQLLRLRRRSLDLGIMREVQAAPDLEVKPLSKERLVAVLPAAHPLGKRPALELRELAAEPFVMSPRQLAPRLVDHLVALCRGAGFEPEVAQESLQFTTLLGLVSSGIGVSIVPMPLTAVTLPGIRFVPLNDTGAFSQLSYAHRPLEDCTPLVRRAAKLLDREFGSRAD